MRLSNPGGSMNVARSFALMVTLFLSLTGKLHAADRPNVLFIAVDDLNHWVGHLGRNAQTKTPNIDRLAARGVSFTHAYCAVPACNPARAALMSGYRPTSTGCYTNNDPWKQYIPEGISLNATFKNNGYDVAGAGKIYHSDSYYASEWNDFPKMKTPEHGQGVKKLEGFQQPVNHDLNDEDISDYHIVDYCIDQLGKRQEKPFFLACGLHKPHLPWVVPKKYYDMFPLDSIELPPFQENDLDDIPATGVKMAGPQKDQAKLIEAGRWKEAIQSYLACIAYTDMNVGRLLDALDKSPYKDNTIIVFWGDHGWHLGEKHHWRKFALWEEATRAPLIISAPGVTPKGELCHRTVDFMTIYPTLCDLAGLKTPSHVQGKSIVPLLKDPSAEWSSYAITTHGQGNHTVRTEKYRLIKYRDGGLELYDETKDPYEWANLATDPKYASTVTELEALLPVEKILELTPGEPRGRQPPAGGDDD